MTPYEAYMAKAAASIDDDRVLNQYTTTGAAVGAAAGARVGHMGGNAMREGNASRIAGQLQKLPTNADGHFLVPQLPEGSLKHVGSLANQIYVHNATLAKLPLRSAGAGAVALGVAGAVPGLALSALNKVERATGGAP